jgi:hypothetical protein
MSYLNDIKKIKSDKESFMYPQIIPSPFQIVHWSNNKRI